MSLLFNMLSEFVIAFFPRSKCLLISWLQLPSAVILEPPKTKSVIASIVSLSICHEVMGLHAMTFIFWMLSFKPAFSLSFIKRLFSSLVPLSFLALGWCHLHIWGYWYFSRQSWLQLVLPLVQRFSWCTLHRRALNPKMSVLIRKRQRDMTQPEEDKATWRRRQRLGWCSYKPRKPVNAGTQSWKRQEINGLQLDI